jgi:hypothetical protein
MNRKISALAVTFLIIVIVVYLNSISLINIVDLSTGLTVALVALLPQLYAWVLNPYFESNKNHSEKIDRSKTKKSTDEPIIFKQEDEKTAKAINTKPVISSLLPDPDQMDKILIDNKKINDIFFKALEEARSVYHDNQLSGIIIQVIPYQGSVNLYFDFYSNISNKITKFRFDEIDGLRHNLPDKDSHNDYDKVVYTSKLPWEANPMWPLFLSRAYEMVKPLSKHKNTCYHLSANAYSSQPWSISFEDGLTGKEPRIDWDGVGFKIKNFKKSWC